MKNNYIHSVSSWLKIFTIFLVSLPVAATAQESMRANLYIVEPTGTTLVDGNLTNYRADYSNDVTMEDAWKMSNPGINLSIHRQGYDLVVERRALIGRSDTTSFRLWNISTQYNYRLTLALKQLNHPGLTAFLKDSYLDSETALDLNNVNDYDFKVNADPKSAAENRFQVVFKTYVAPPVDASFTAIESERSGKDISLQWVVANEGSMNSYVIEHSTDGKIFSDVEELLPSAGTQLSKTYNYLHATASVAAHFYRIRAISASGKIQYSPITKVNALYSDYVVNVYPNPVVNKKVQLLFNNQAAGKYQVVLVYSSGARLQLQSFQLGEGQSSQPVMLPQNLQSGIYQLQLTGPTGFQVVKSIQVL